jgi:microcystin-dependent protein
MAVLFPTSLDSSTFPAAATLTAETLAVEPHSKLHDELGQAILALETKVGITGSADTASLDYLVNHPLPGLPTGSLVPYAGTAAPSGFLWCDGTLYNIVDYTDLHGVIGTAFGSGSGTFGVPDLRGRAIIGLDNLGGSSAASRVVAATAMGHAAGEETHLLTGAESGTSVHNHPPATGDTGFIDGNFGGTDGVGAGSIARLVAHTGNSTAANAGSAHNNLQPYLALNVLIKT